jgi:methyl-accepting chemotaxis protein-1 (serine sensor receptor)
MKTSSLQFKVLLLMAGAMAVALAVSVTALTRVYHSIQELDSITREDFETQQAILRATIAFKQQVQEWKDVLLRGRDPAALERFWKGFEKSEREAIGSAREALASTPHENVRTALEKFIALHKAAGEGYRKGLETFKAANFDPSAGDQAVTGIDQEPTQVLLDVQTTASDIGAQRTLDAVRNAESGYRMAIGGTILAMLLALGALWVFFRRAVLVPIETAVRFAERIAQGDLSAEIRATSDDEAGKLLKSLDRMNSSLADVVTQVRSSAETVVAASGQVAASTTDLSQRTEEQASSLEETAASMEELSSTVKQNADNAHQADELARSAFQRAEQVGREVARVVVTMGGISEGSKRIADIISVIDGIAFQTNILALNAAVEAARAGEQGRGFAVVASEVRSLAQRSAQAAKEIKGLIGESVAQVDDGTKLVEQAGATISALVVDAKRVSGLMGSIAEASAEQSRGVQQVNKTVTEMDKVVQQNASAVQQSASAAEAMRRQAEALLRAVGAFRVERLAPQAAPAAGRLAAGAPGSTAALRAGGPAAASLPRKPSAADGPGDDWEEF